MAILSSSVLLPFFLLSALASASPRPETRAVSDASLTDVSTAFSKAGIVPGLVPVFNPTGLLDVVFTDGTTQKAVNATPGTNLTMQQTADEPKFVLTVSNTTTASTAEFVIALVDPDAPTPQNTSLGQFRHFLGAGYRWSADTGVLTNSTAAPTEWFSPAPPAGSDPHRYLVLAYVQPDDFASKVSSILNATTPRTNFNVTAFSNTLGLGAPFAGTFFITGPDSTPTSSAPSSAASSGASASASATPQGSGATALHSQLTVTGAFAAIMAMYFLK
ncbi:PEBP-like protein [Mycena albidolilacea]|uniref:PEBP-like protein n=1 Tax=Mycena albidolilacea TaxID=1033008 RepID=A0AAD7AQQ7_9AGAR|nr:PEBP-like protein [Mycena albidolilacea]